MNRKIIIIGMFLSIIFLSIIIFNLKGKENISKNIYFLQIGVYKEKNNLIKVTKALNTYLIDKKNNQYYIYVGITGLKENADKIKAFYKKRGNNIYIKTIVLSNEDFLNNLEKYDELLKNTNDNKTIEVINKKILKKYEEVIDGENI